MTNDEIKEKCNEWALQWKEKTGKFPLHSDWLIKQNSSPIGKNDITKLFDGYNNFRKYCNEPINVLKIEKITIEWVKENCLINDYGCWEWQKSKFHDGYGRLHNTSIHRFVYSLVYGVIPDNLVVRHLCHNKICCNPVHLKVGTKKDNAKDNKSREIIITTNTELRLISQKFSLEDKIKFYILQSNTIITNGSCIESNIKSYYNKYLNIEHNNKRYQLHRLIVAQNENLDYNNKSWVARHICNNRRCINPEHLKPGTLSDNSLDSREYSKATKLTKEQVIEIKTDWKNNSSSYKYKKDFDEFWADKFNVSSGNIKHLRNNNTWKDIIV